MFDLPDREPTINRLLRNAEDVKRALVPFYGEELTTILEQLLTEHLTIAARLVQAAIDGDQERANNARIQWYINAVQIAQFLACINLCWSKEQWQEMLFEHLRITEQEAVFMISGQYQQGVDIYDEIEKQALEMADLMTFGIVAQFPDLFD